MKKQSRGVLFLWLLIVAMIAGGTFLICEHLGVGSRPLPESAMAPSLAAAQTFSNDGYRVNIPASWTIEQTGSDTIALHPDASSSDAACKIEVSAFASVLDAGRATWIAHRIGGDSSLAVVEQSSEDVSLDGGPGVKWIGTIDAIPTTLVYAFNDQHAYEIAPSVIGEGADGAVPCGEMLQTFLSGFTI